MFTACRSFTRHSFRSTVAALMLVLLLSGPTPAVGKERGNASPGNEPVTSCFVSRLPVPDGRVAGVVAPRLTVDREDLLVTVRWPAEPSRDPTYLLSTSAGAVASWPAQQTPGEETVQRLSGALAHVATAGFQYFLELRGADGLLGWQTFRLTVSCGSGPCVYRLLPGFEGGPLTMSRKLWDAVAEARAGGAGDLLASVRQTHPELAAEIPGFAWQWQQAAGRDDGCSCQWVSTESFSPMALLGPPSDQPPTHESGINMEGAGFFAGVQSIDGAIDLSLTGAASTTAIGLELLCTLDLGGQQARYPTSWPSMPELEVVEPILEPCPAPCTPVIEHRTEVRGCVQGGATSRLNMPGWSKAEIDVGVALDGNSTLAAAAAIKVDISDNELVRKIELIDKVSTATLNAESVSVEIGAGTLLEAEGTLEPDTGTYSYAFAAAALEYRTLLLAPPICDLPEGRAYADHPLRGFDDGGVTMERWENP